MKILTELNKQEMNKIEEFLKDVKKANIINKVMFDKLNEIAGRYKTSDEEQLTLTDVVVAKRTLCEHNNCSWDKDPNKLKCLNCSEEISRA